MIEDDVLSIELKFSPDEDRPDKVFNSFQIMFEALMAIQEDLIKKIDPLLDVNFFLTNVRAASIWSDMTRKTIVVKPNDSVLINPNPVGDVNRYVNQSTDTILANIGQNDELVKNESINMIIDQIDKIAKTTDVDKNPNFHPASKVVVANSIIEMEKSTSLLALSDSYSFSRPNGKSIIQIKHVYSDIDLETLRNEDVVKVIESNIDTVLKIKIADFLGNSKWKFKLSTGKSIDAKIEDIDWLESFHNHNTLLGPGDSLHIQGNLKEYVDAVGNVVESEYIILKVLEVQIEKK